jgi:hypothetical protein
MAAVLISRFTPELHQLVRRKALCFEAESCPTNSHKLANAIVQEWPDSNCAIVVGWACANGSPVRHVWVRYGESNFDPTWEADPSVVAGCYFPFKDCRPDERVEYIETFFRIWLDEAVPPKC